LSLARMILRIVCKRREGIRLSEQRRRRLRITGCILSALVALVGDRPVLGQSNPSSEYEVKAAFLFHFAQFVEWPPDTFKEAGTPLVYCTIGEDPFHGSLEAALNGKTIGARSLHVRHLKQPSELQGCQVVFLGEKEKRLFPTVLELLKGSPVLIVGESEHFVQDGGTIGFFLEQNKIRFEINLEAAEKAKLKISSRLLALAKTVVGNPRGT
jgi:hypothetical protein